MRQRPDLRTIEPISGPFEIMEARPSSPHMGGTLDRGLTGRLPDGRRIVIGEIWAACPDENHDKVSIDTDAMALRVVTALNYHDQLIEALENTLPALEWAATHTDGNAVQFSEIINRSRALVEVPS